MKCSGIFFFRVAFLLNYSYCIASECVIQICNYLFICLVTLNQQLERVLRTILYCIIYLFENFIFKNCRVQNKQQHVYIAMVLNCTLQCTASINVPRGCNEKKKKEKRRAVIYIASGFRSGRTREPVTFMCAPAISPPESRLINQRSEQSSIIVTREIPG